MCPLSLLSLAMPHLPHSHKCHASLHSHTWRALCGSSHPHTHWLADCPHTLHTPPPLGVRVLIHLLSSATHTHTGRTGVAHAWVVAGVVTTTTPLVPHHHTHTQRDWWCGPWWCLVVRVCPVCASHATITLAFPPTTTTNALVPPPPSHTHRTWCMHHCHTHATCTTTHTKACCVLTTPCHTHHHPLHPPIHTHTPHGTHTRHQPHCHNGACHRSPRRPLTHTTDATHTPHRRQTKAKHTTGCGFS